MANYYIFIPGYDVTAEVSDAPDARHARTAFLDYLHRKGLIQYSDRGRIRDNMKTVKAEPGEMEPTVRLDYAGGRVISEEEVPVVSVQPQMEEEEEDYVPRREEPFREPAEPLPDEDLDLGYEEEEEEEEPVRKPPPSRLRKVQADVEGIFGKSPIMDLSRKTGAM